MTLGLDVREKTIGDMLKSRWLRDRRRRQMGHGPGTALFCRCNAASTSSTATGTTASTITRTSGYGVPSMFRGNKRTEEDKGTYATDVFRREAMRFVKESAGKKPFFLYCLSMRLTVRRRSAKARQRAKRKRAKVCRHQRNTSPCIATK